MNQTQNILKRQRKENRKIVYEMMGEAIVAISIFAFAIFYFSIIN